MKLFLYHRPIPGIDEAENYSHNIVYITPALIQLAGIDDKTDQNFRNV